MSADTGKSKTHWAEWEIGCLIYRTIRGVGLGGIATGMDRSVSACRTMLGRLLKGEAECPASDTEALEKLREQNTPKPHTRQADQQIIEQYLQLAKNDEAIKATLAEVETMITYSLAMDVYDERITLDEIAHLCPGEMAHAVGETFGKIRLFRREHADLFDKGPSATLPTGRQVSHQPPAKEETDRLEK